MADHTAAFPPGRRRAHGLDRRTALLAGLAAAGLAGTARAQTAPPTDSDSTRGLVLPDPTETIDLWPGGAPGAPAVPPVEKTTERSTDPAYNDRFVTNISRPRLIVFRPARPNGGAMLITPGGGYSVVVVDKEGYELGRLLAEHGITAFVLFYRLPHQGWAAGPDTALSDAQRAMRIIRHRAGRYGIDPRRVGAMGFSAGGHLCADLMTRFDARVYAPVDAADRMSARPDAAAPIYPVISMTLPDAHAGSRRNLIGEGADAARERAHSPDHNVPENAPPAFLLHAEDDGVVPVNNALLLRAALRAKGVAVETHLFPDGGHGFGLRQARGTSVERWPLLYLDWLRRVGIAG